MDRASRLSRVLRAAALTAVGLFFLFPLFWVVLMSFQTNDDILRIPPSLVFTPTLDNYAALFSGQFSGAGSKLADQLCRQSRQQLHPLDGRRAFVPRPRHPRRLRLRALQVPRRREHRLDPALLPLRAGAARALAAEALFPGDRPRGHLFRPDLGLPAHHPAPRHLDRARLFRGRESGHRIRLSDRRPFLVGDLQPDRGSPRPPRHRGGRRSSPSSSPGTTSSSRSSSPPPTSSR